jgi:hypothetical protein
LIDEVIVVGRAGKTDAGSARRTAEALALLKAPVVGVALNCVPTGLVRRAADRSWYRYQPPDRRRGRRGPTVDVTAVPAASGAREHGGNGGTRTGEEIPHLARPSGKE